MKKTTLLIALFIIYSLTVTSTKAQTNNKKQMTMAQLTWGNPEYIGISGPKSQQWLNNKIIYVKGDSLWAFDPESNNKKVLFTTKSLNEINEIKIKSNISFPAFSVIGDKNHLLAFNIEDRLKVVDPDKKQVVHDIPLWTGNVLARKISPSFKHIAIVKDHNLYILNDCDTTYQNKIQITNDGSPTIVYGQSVHQNEFGINKGLFWSNDGNKLAFYRMDQSMIPPYPILNIPTTKEATQRPQYYPMAGGKCHVVTLGLYDIKTKKTIYIKTNHKNNIYLTNVTFSPNGDKIYIAEVNREQTTINLNEYDAFTGEKTKTLFTETDQKYAEPLNPMFFLPNNSKQFIWISRKDGFRHIYLYNTAGKQLKQLTKGEWEVTDVIGFDPSGKNFIYTSTEKSPLDRNNYMVSITTGKRRCLNNEPGFHNVSFSGNGKFFLDTYSSNNVPRIDEVYLTKNNKSVAVLNKSSDPDKNYLMPKIEISTIKASDDSTMLYCRTILPSNFDPSKKYPVIVYVYNGPHAQLIQNKRHWGAMPFSLAAANDGFIVFTVDGRGSDARGKQFEQVIHRNLGVNEMADQMQGIKHLKSLPYVDSNRIGVYGWSFGGFMSINLMLNHSDIFKVGVAGGPVTNWAFYEIMYGERYMDTPQENPKGYEQANLIKQAGKLKGRLLIIHGTSDPVVMWQHSLAFIRSAVDNNTYPDYMVYPGHEHNVRGVDRIHLNNNILRYFKDHLK